ncbi:MAG: hypothetical protein PHU93_02305, partial [Candidatus Gracilibacteria bacterium]|nr:hypothetical protein [Candidatus Gracilibacteria bacterium]
MRTFAFFQNKFRLLSIIYFIATAILIGISVKWNFFHMADPTTYFSSVGAMFGSILALLITIHFFYVQNFANYAPLTFIFDASTDKTTYLVTGFIGLATIVFFFLGGNSFLLLNACPDHLLFPFSLAVEAFVIWLTLFFFHSISQKLSPSGMVKNVEGYFTGILEHLKKYKGLLAAYLKKDSKKQETEDSTALMTFGISMLEGGWYKLEALFDGVQKLISNQEYTLARDYLGIIDRCFSRLMDAYGEIKTIPNLDYFGSHDSEIDRGLNRFFERLEDIVLFNVNRGDVYAILESLKLYKNVVVKFTEIDYTGRLFSGENPLLERALIRYAGLFDKILKTGNTEGLFQWKENAGVFINLLISKKTDLHYIDELLNKLNIIAIWEVQNKRSLETYKIYSNTIFRLITADLGVQNDRIVREAIKENLKLVISFKESGVNITPFVNNIIQDVWTNLSINRGNMAQILLDNANPLQPVHAVG